MNTENLGVYTLLIIIALYGAGKVSISLGATSSAIIFGIIMFGVIFIALVMGSLSVINEVLIEHARKRERQ